MSEQGWPGGKARGGKAGRKQTSLPACRKLPPLPRLLLRAGSAANHKNLNRPRVLKISAQKGNPTTATTNGKCFNDDASHMSQQQQQQQSQPVATLRAARQLANGSWPATFYATHRQHEEQLQQKQQQLPMAEKDRTGTDEGRTCCWTILLAARLTFISISNGHAAATATAAAAVATDLLLDTHTHTHTWAAIRRAVANWIAGHLAQWKMLY